MEAIDIIRQVKVVPVVVIRRIEDTLPTLAAMLSGSLPVAEITFRTDCAAEAIKLGCTTFPDMMIGAGTVINAAQAELAIGCGAKFIVSPGFSPEVADICKENRIPYIPGCVTPTEIMAALSHGIDLVKFFPAENYGGISTIKALTAAFPSVSFLPTGGVTKENIRDYLTTPHVVACGGSFMMKGDFDEIAAKCADAMRLVSSIYTR